VGMSRDTSLPAGVVTAATAPSYQACHAVRIGFATPLLLCDGPGNLTINGETYSEGLISLGGVTVGANPAVTLRVRNGANEVSAVDADGDGLRDVPVLLYEVMWDPATNVQLDPVLLFSGVVNQGQYGGPWADLQCVSRVQGSTGAGMVGRYVSQICGHVFRGARCGYAGPETLCDRTMARCQALANFQRFGGWPSVPQIGTVFKYKVANGTTLADTAGASIGTAVIAVPPITAPSVGGNGSTVRRHLQRA
jgi:hypothetical protein